MMVYGLWAQMGVPSPTLVNFSASLRSEFWGSHLNCFVTVARDRYLGSSTTRCLKKVATADSNEKERCLALEDVIKKVKGMTNFGSKAFKYAFDEHLDVVDVTWEDCARDKASIWG